MKRNWLKTLITGVAVLVIVSGVAIGAIEIVNAKPQAVVTKVIDGDTIVVNLKGETTRVRLLNIDTPEMSEPDCLAIEAKEYLEERIPPGTKIELRFDAELKDRFGRTLAGVFLGEELINASIASVGLGKAVVFGKNYKFFHEVTVAELEAKRQNLGIHGSTPEHCTLFTQRTKTLRELEKVQSLNSGNIQNLKDHTGTILAAVVAAETLGNKIEKLNGEGKRVFRLMTGGPSDSSSALVREIKEAKKHQQKLEKKRDGLITKKKEAERKKAEAKKRAEAKKKAEAERRSQQAAAEQARRNAQLQHSTHIPRQQDQYRPAPSPKPAPQYRPAPRPANPYPGYTGPRCYAPGGKTWRPCPRP